MEEWKLWAVFEIARAEKMAESEWIREGLTGVSSVMAVEETIYITFKWSVSEGTIFCARGLLFLSKQTSFRPVRLGGFPSWPKVLT